MSATNKADMGIAMQAAGPDPAQKRRLIMGVAVFALGWVLTFILIPIINNSTLAGGLNATLSGVLVLGLPKVFLLIAVVIMGKPGFAFLKSLLAARFRRFAPPATVSASRYRVGLILLLTPMILSSIGDYVSVHLIPVRQQYPYLLAMMGDALILLGLFVLGGDFWDKLRSLFSHQAKAVFPAK